jgi:hypothetical protein
MTSRRLQWLLSCAALVLLAVGTALAQSGRAGTPAELMSALKVGQWVKIEGPAGNTPVVQCSEAKMLTGDFLDGDWQVTADVRRVDATKGTFSVFTMPCKVGDSCTFKSKVNPGFISIGQLKPGMHVNVEGTFLRDGTLLARKVADKADELVEKPEHKGLVRLRGRIDKVNASGQSVTVMGITFQINSRTQAKSVIR